MNNIKNDDYTKGNYAISYTEIPSKSTQRVWCDSMVGGNGLNGFLTSGSPYSDTFIFQYMWFNFPFSEPRHSPKELLSQLEDARLNVFNLNDKWRVLGPDGEPRKRTNFYSFHPGHQLRLNISDKSEISTYKRYTNYETGEVGVRFEDNNGEWKRTTFTSHVDNVTITKISKSSTNKKINLVISIDDISGIHKSYDKLSEVSKLKYKKLVGNDADYIAQVAHYPSYSGSELADGGYAGFTRVICEGGTAERIILSPSDEVMNVGADKNPAIKICNANFVYLITKSDRTHTMGKIEDFEDTCDYEIINRLSADTKAVQDKYSKNFAFDYNSALKPSAQKQAEMFNRVNFKLNGDNSDHTLDNESLIAAQKAQNGRINHAFAQQVYNQGRYAQTACGGYSAPRLYGMWTGEFNPGWRGIYTLDANVNLQVSAMNTGAMREMAEGYISFFLRNARDFMQNATDSYGMHDAIQVPINSDGDRAMQVEYDNSYPFQYWNSGASWCLMPIFEYWQCYGNAQIPIREEMRLDDLKPVLSVNDGGLSDSEFEEIKNRGTLDLERDILLPLLTKQSNFWEQICTPEYYIDKDGKACHTVGKKCLDDGEKYMIIPTFSPENHPIGYSSTITANATMDISAARYGLEMTIELEKTVKRDGYEKAVEKWETLKSQLADYKLDEDGALCEWAMDNYTENNNHRHLSHLYLAWPTYETQNDAELSKAANIALNNRNEFNITDATAGHGWMHKALVEARLKRCDGMISSLLPMTNGTAYFTSLMTDHDCNCRKEVYCTDTLLGTLGVINEALIFSNTGEIEFLPALPIDWKSGELNGTLARCRAVVDMLNWDLDKKSVNAKITSNTDNNTIEIKCGIKWVSACVNGKEYSNSNNVSITLNNNESAEICFTI